VKRISDHCFHNCEHLTAVIIPMSVETIGDYAFSQVVLDKLVIPNSVIEIGIGCFDHAEIKTTFKLPKHITTIPKKCFYYSKLPYLDFIRYSTEIGDYAFMRTKLSNNKCWNGTISLSSSATIGKGFIIDQRDVQLCELFSCLRKVDADAFEDLSVRYFSVSPIRVDYNAFNGVGSDATLIVPPKTKLIFDIREYLPMVGIPSYSRNGY